MAPTSRRFCINHSWFVTSLALRFKRIALCCRSAGRTDSVFLLFTTTVCCVSLGADMDEDRHAALTDWVRVAVLAAVCYLIGSA